MSNNFINQISINNQSDRRQVSDETSVNFQRTAGSKLATCFTLVSCLANSSSLKLEATCSSETSVDFQQTTWSYIPQDTSLPNHSCENPNSYKKLNSLKACENG
jgi:hypothetical protein